MKYPPDVVYTGLKGAIGSPEDYNNNKKSGHFPSHFDLKIPMSETDQHKGSITGSLDAALNGMNIEGEVTKEKTELIQH